MSIALSKLKRKFFLSFLILLILATMSDLVWFTYQNSFYSNQLAYQQIDYQLYLKNVPSPDFSQHKNLDYLKAIGFVFDKDLPQGDNQLVAVVDVPITMHPSFSQKLLLDQSFEQSFQAKLKDIDLPEAKPNSHGNLVTGLINGDDIGLATHALVMPVAVNHMGYQDADTATFAYATKLLLEKRIPIINHANTWGTEILFYGRSLNSNQVYDPYQILPALEKSDTVLVMAAGNQHQNYKTLISILQKQNLTYSDITRSPNILKKVVYVGIFDNKNGTIANQSNYPGDSLELQQRFIIVPDLPLISSNSEQGYQNELRGTSFASAVISGSIAWLMSQDKTLSATQATDILLDTAQPPCQQPTENCQPKFYGKGMLNLSSALLAIERRKNKIWYPILLILNKFQDYENYYKAHNKV